MKACVVFSVLGAAVAPAFASVVARQSKGNLPPVTVRGNAFFAGDERFYVRGVAYQPGLLSQNNNNSNTILMHLRWRGRRCRSAARPRGSQTRC
jgi:hypothetical protein